MNGPEIAAHRPARAAVAGGAGYAGGELLRLLSWHPGIEVTQVASERLAGRPVAAVHPQLRGRTDLRFSAWTALEPVDILFSALRHGDTAPRIDELCGLARIVVDLSADFRLHNPDDYPTWYGWVHPRPELLSSFTSGLAELHRAEISGSDRLAIGGCVATAAILALAPMVREGVVDPRLPIVVDALVGSSAAGSEPSPTSHHPHRSGAMHSFSPTGHRHSAEILQELAALGEVGEVALSVTSVEAVRGILVTAHLWLRDPLEEREVWRMLRAATAAEPFLRVVKQAHGLHRHPDPRLVTGTNRCDLGFSRDPRSLRLVVTAAIDNLVKGAAGQAVQAANLRLGL
ncbi:MAG TPA: N-acetyl-gamma-glutamyl-phosphate reductase, partial [Candidatus Binatia bacterium]|nr:N-acetyl-gamma-glutamyl-phosphate reductase [Candidatus Binatia bacterium]